MSRRRLPRAEKDLYARHSQRIVRALQVDDLDYHGYAVLSFLVDLIDLPGRNGEVMFTLGGLADALGWPLGHERLRQKLHELRRRRWIDFDAPRRGPGSAWIFRLTGAEIDAERDEFPTNFQRETPSHLETNSNPSREAEAANPLPDSDSEPLEFPTAVVPRAEQSRAEVLSEENHDHLVGKTTAAALESERAFLAELQDVFVVNGGGTWRENDDDDEDRSERR